MRFGRSSAQAATVRGKRRRLDVNEDGEDEADDTGGEDKVEDEEKRHNDDDEGNDEGEDREDEHTGCACDAEDEAASEGEARVGDDAAEEDLGVVEEAEENVEEEEEEERVQMAFELLEPPIKSARLPVHGQDPLEWVIPLLREGPCEIPSMPRSIRRMLADMWAHACPQPDASVHHPHIVRVLRMVAGALADYRGAVAARAAEAAAAASDEATDRGKAEELIAAVAAAKASRAAGSAGQAAAAAALATARADTVKAKAAARAAAQEVSRASSVEKASETGKSAAEAALATFAALEASGPDGAAAPTGSRAVATLRQRLREVEVLLEKADAREVLMPSALRRVLPALKLRPQERDRFDQAALAAAEGCLTARLEEAKDHLSANIRLAAAASARLRRASAETSAVHARTTEASERVRLAKSLVRSAREALAKAVSAERRHAMRLKAVAAEASAGSTALAEAERVVAAVTAAANALDSTAQSSEQSKAAEAKEGLYGQLRRLQQASSIDNPPLEASPIHESTGESGSCGGASSVLAQA